MELFIGNDSDALTGRLQPERFQHRRPWLSRGGSPRPGFGVSIREASREAIFSAVSRLMRTSIATSDFVADPRCAAHRSGPPFIAAAMKRLLNLERLERGETPCRVKIGVARPPERDAPYQRRL